MVVIGANDFRPSDYRFPRVQSDSVPLLPLKIQKSWLQIIVVSFAAIVPVALTVAYFVA